MTPKTIEDEISWIDKKFVKGFARLRCLCLIEQGHDSGYDMIKCAKNRFHLKLSAAAVYPVLQSLEADGYITGEWVEGKHPHKRRYSLTPVGRKVLAALRKRVHVLMKELTGKKRE